MSREIKSKCNFQNGFTSVIKKINSLKRLIICQNSNNITTMTSIANKNSGFIQNVINKILKGRLALHDKLNEVISRIDSITRKLYKVQ